MNKAWHLYILQCGDGTLYTGVTNDIEKRLEAHRQGKGAKYTRGRGPLQLVYQETCENRSHALQREIEIKKLPKTKKLLLISCSSSGDDFG